MTTCGQHPPQKEQPDKPARGHCLSGVANSFVSIDILLNLLE